MTTDGAHVIDHDNTFNCDNHQDGFYASPRSCLEYFICAGDIAYSVKCADGLVFNADTGFCDYPEHFRCTIGDSPVVTTSLPVVQTTRQHVQTTNAPSGMTTHPPSGHTQPPHVTGKPNMTVTQSSTTAKTITSTTKQVFTTQTVGTPVQNVPATTPAPGITTGMDRTILSQIYSFLFNQHDASLTHC
ncbi:hypothetical protein BaRGS_00002466 [Batillaria attramentaria]|uniref:Chitin-binding type-2 domain-containing protein n=1 Tax=Batillaria attramentaria TaxID=370345 RepID=A0ABD0M3F9_9CAEN